MPDRGEAETRQDLRVLGPRPTGTPALATQLRAGQHRVQDRSVTWRFPPGGDQDLLRVNLPTWRACPPTPQHYGTICVPTPSGSTVPWTKPYSSAVGEHAQNRYRTTQAPAPAAIRVLERTPHVGMGANALPDSSDGPVIRFDFRSTTNRRANEIQSLPVRPRKNRLTSRSGRKSYDLGPTVVHLHDGQLRSHLQRAAASPRPAPQKVN